MKSFFRSFGYGVVLTFFVGGASSAWSAVPPTALTDREAQEIDQAITKFYANDETSMDDPTPKYSVKTGERVAPRQLLKLKDDKAITDPLLKQAQLKGTDHYLEKYCKYFVDKKFPSLKCSIPDGRATAQKNDKVQNLVDSWMTQDLVEDLDSVPTEGETAASLWSDDYWAIKYGATSYRYSEGAEFATYREAVDSYAQPEEFTKMLEKLSLAKLAEKVLGWSISEKYDLSVGDEKFTLTNEQKNEGKEYEKDGDVEEWMGICHGWAPATYMVPAPTKPVTVKGLNDVKVTWYPSEVRGLASLAYANGSSETNFVGGRCNSKEVKRFRNGRLAQQECFDNAPNTFHLALANLIGIEKSSFVMDKTFDYEVWNQPIVSYRFTYFNPLQPQKKSKTWSDVAVDYDRRFKRRDRFQRPNTRGKEGDDEKIAKVVGVIATVVYLAEVSPTWGEEAGENSYERLTMVYDLELEERGGHYIATGGEWHNNNHPDFLWTPKKDSVAFHAFDKANLAYEGEANEKTVKAASRASEAGYPLCQVVKHLVEGSSGESYSCRSR